MRLTIDIYPGMVEQREGAQSHFRRDRRGPTNSKTTHPSVTPSPCVHSECSRVQCTWRYEIRRHRLLRFSPQVGSLFPQMGEAQSCVRARECAGARSTPISPETAALVHRWKHSHDHHHSSSSSSSSAHHHHHHNHAPPESNDPHVPEFLERLSQYIVSSRQTERKAELRALQDVRVLESGSHYHFNVTGVRDWCELKHNWCVKKDNWFVCTWYVTLGLLL